MSQDKFLTDNYNYQKKENHFDVVIVGSGASGIGAAMTLDRNGLSYLVL